MAIFLDKPTLLDMRAKDGFSLKADFFNGDARTNLQATGSMTESLMDRNRSKVITMGSPRWDGTESQVDMWHKLEVLMHKMRKVEMAAQLPSDLNDLVDLLRYDITRRILGQDDYTSIVGIERINPGFGASARLDEFLMPGAAFSQIKGNNDTLKLLEHKTGATGTVDFLLWGVGDKITLANELFNTLYKLSDINEAVSRGFRAIRNDLSVLGQMVAKTAATGWNASQQVAADTTSGATKMELLHNTLSTAIQTVANLTDPQTTQKIGTQPMILVIPTGTELAFGKVLPGLPNGAKVGVYPALTQIQTVIPYAGDTIYMGEEKFSYPGVATGKAYLFVPRVANYTLVKRGMTMEQGQGSVLELSRMERAWYFSQTKYDTEFFGGSAGLTAGSGFCVEITLPSL